MFIRGAKAFVDTPSGPVRTFERPELYDGAKLSMRVFNSPSKRVVEGFCLFAYPAIMDLPGVRFYVDVPFEVCLERRMARRPHRPSDRSFALVGRQENDTFVLPQKTAPGVMVLDGLKPPSELVEEVLRSL